MSDAYEVIEAWENENVGDPRYDIEVEAVREFVAWLKAEGWRIVKLEKVRWERVSEHGTVYSYTVEDEL